ncbi:RHS repeat-associated core domain-containing protein [Pseudomonas sp. TNT2022 ID642]|uniref:RHS repeat-associated core domain-containing protein n=1 Tax=Pseudomonas sp. TNT2022 ID642 TaxID=2942632 RepID=UPI00235E9704|nr:RHS repeat-associated core domain-containing protein [Pseudomonas sp. TNT2022 ID642]MDD1005145.1 RHS repeat-associated core domain-containing protein [Pseudomonas sp. TNT2022 ID642]
MNQSVHWRTPALRAHDPRHLLVRNIAYLRTVAGADVESQVSRQQHDTAGRVIKQWDPRLSVPCLTTAHRLDGEALKIDSVDAGWRLTLPGLAGEPLERWDERGSHWHTTFDGQLRVMEVEENGEPKMDVFTYADASADAGYNRRGQLLKQKDRSGSLSTNSFSLTGQPLSEIRTFHDDQAFTSHHVFSPLGALLEQTDAGGHRRRSHYGLAGQLKQVDLWISGTPDWQPVLLDAQYNANDQIIEQLAGNRVLSQWTYDPADGRLHTQSSRKDNGAVLQNLEYFYDPVGNITRIEDHAFQPRYFANQMIDGHRDFTYDSLYRMTSATGYDDAPPTDIPGLPQPGDPNNRLNYTQTYRYDNGGNLIELRHVRAGNNSTRQMFIDPHSNRGVRWKTGDPEPAFDDLFDRHGNQKTMHPGKPLTWNARDELESVTLIQRENDRSDAEYYRYSQGMRVFKRHETFAANAEHFHQVRYVPGLEIRTRDNGEELHVITLGNARCLHWAAEKPNAIANDQMRYNLEDHLGSSVMELDQDAVMISQEGYYPFGETAWMAPDSETTYRFIRYSGKEMDVSGLYYYGARYYAPWLQRWVSADPAGDVDGLNLYGFVRNNAMTYVDRTGNETEVAQPSSGGVLAFITGNTPRERMQKQLAFHNELLSAVDLAVRDVTTQILNHRSEPNSRVSTAKRTGFFLAEKGTSNAVGIGMSAAGVALGIPGGPLGMLIGGALGFVVGKTVSKTTKAIGRKTGLNTSISLQPDRLRGTRLLKQTQAEQGPVVNFKAIADYNPLNPEGRQEIKQGGIAASKELALAGAGKIPYVGPAIKVIPDTIDLLNEIKNSANDLTEDEVTALDADITGTINMLQHGSEHLIETVKTLSATDTAKRIDRIENETGQRIKMLRNLRTVLHSNSSTFTAV